MPNSTSGSTDSLVNALFQLERIGDEHYIELEKEFKALQRENARLNRLIEELERRLTAMDESGVPWRERR